MTNAADLPEVPPELVEAAAGIACELPVAFGYAERVGKQIVAKLAAARRA